MIKHLRNSLAVVAFLGILTVGMLELAGPDPRAGFASSLDHYMINRHGALVVFHLSNTGTISAPVGCEAAVYDSSWHALGYNARYYPQLPPGRTILTSEWIPLPRAWRVIKALVACHAIPDLGIGWFSADGWGWLP